MNPGYMLAAGLVAAVVAMGTSQLLFSNRERGMSASQWLLTGLLWGIMMLLVYLWMRY